MIAPSCKWLCRWEWPIQKQCKTPFLGLHEPHLNFSDFSVLCAVFLLRTWNRWQFCTKVCHFWFMALCTTEKHLRYITWATLSHWDEWQLSKGDREEKGCVRERSGCRSYFATSCCVSNFCTCISSFRKDLCHYLNKVMQKEFPEQCQALKSIIY